LFNLYLDIQRSSRGEAGAKLNALLGL